MVHGGMKCIKYLLFLFNFFFVVIGAVLIGIGVSTKNGWNEKYLAFMNLSEFSTPPNLLIGVGCLIFFIAFLGCCGAIKENHCMMMSYAVLVGLILVLELGAAFAAFALRDDATNLLTDGLMKSQEKYGKNSTEEERDITKGWDVLQNELHCCGTLNYTDWNSLDYPVAPNVPESCCLEDNPGCSLGITPSTPLQAAQAKIYTDGCLHKAIDDFAVGTLGTIALVLSAVELFGIICACFLSRSIRYSYETV